MSGPGRESGIEGDARAHLEREFLPDFLPRQRWFAGKARPLDSVRIADVSLDAGLPGGLTIALVEARFRDGGADLYFLPLATRQKAPTDPPDFHDALADPMACLALLDGIGAGREVPMERGTIRAVRTEAFEAARGPDEALQPVRLGSAEQSNSTVFFGDRLILKVFRRLEPGLNPDFEIGRFLTEQAHFDRIPPTAGAIEYVRQGEPPATVAILQRLVLNQGSGWEHALDGLGRYYEDVANRSDMPPEFGPVSLLDLAATEPPATVVERLGAALQDAATLGRRTAELHLALASDDHDPDFAPLPMTAEDLEALAGDIREQVERTLSTLRDTYERLPEAVKPEAHRVLDGSLGLLDPLGTLSALPAGSTRIRVHGDYHLGQVLRVDQDYVILDFEGEPARPLAKRRARQSPIKDVVGMLRSFDYAAHAGLFAASEGRPSAERERLAPWARDWQSWTSACFLRAYLDTAGGAAFLPRDRVALDQLLRAFTLDKAMYELLYELNNRPDWVRIPLQGIISLIEPERGIGAAEN